VVWQGRRGDSPPYADRHTTCYVTTKAGQVNSRALIIDCTEQPVQRPSRKQRCWYSGKKKRHTVKNEIVVTESGKIAAVSNDAPGRVHDIEVRRRGPPLPKGAHGHADSGYQGYQNDHPALESLRKDRRKTL
jgi:hypothetical protein